jgi:hypothetical protein
VYNFSEIIIYIDYDINQLVKDIISKDKANIAIKKNELKKLILYIITII